MVKKRGQNVVLNYGHEEGKQPFRREQFNGPFNLSGSFNLEGRIGIGTTSPYWDIEIRKPVPGILLADTNDDDNDCLIVVTSKLLLFQNRDSDNTYQRNFGSFSIEAPASSLVLNSDGNFGIGTSSPTSNLEVIGELAIYANTTDDEGLTFQIAYSGGNTSGRIFFKEANSKLYGFSAIYAGSTNPTFDGTAFSLTGNEFYIVGHNGALAGTSYLSIARATGDISISESRFKLEPDAGSSTTGTPQIRFNTNDATYNTAFGYDRANTRYYWTTNNGSKMRLNNSGQLYLNLGTADLEIMDAGTAAATEDGWIEVKVGAATHYIRTFTGK